LLIPVEHKLTACFLRL